MLFGCGVDRAGWHRHVKNRMFTVSKAIGSTIPTFNMLMSGIQLYIYMYIQNAKHMPKRTGHRSRRDLGS